MKNPDEQIDVLCFGETMIRFTPRDYERFQQTTQIEAHVGGSESNTAVGLSRLGHNVVWMSRLTDNPLGRKIQQAISAHGVDTSYVAWTDDARIGTYYMERGANPRGSQVYYDRANSAMCFFQEQDFPLELVDSGLVHWLHTTGITLGVSQQTREATSSILNRASGKLKISFDVNYRARLWEPSAAADVCDQIAALADLVFIPIRDARTLYKVSSTSAEGVLKELHGRWPHATIALTLGADGAAAISSAADIFFQSAFSAEQVERLGGGDAFSAGFLSSFLREENIPRALEWGAAAAAVKYTIPGDLPVFDFSMVERLIGTQGDFGLER